MQAFLSMLISAIVQVALFSLVPFIWWLSSARGRTPFFKWIGLKRVESDNESPWVLVLVTTIGLATVNYVALQAFRGADLATSQFSGQGVTSLPTIFIYAFIKTSLAEEVLFRGFLLKRLSCRFGFTVVNILQSAIFGLMHGIMFAPLVGAPLAILAAAITGGLACIMGYINERKAGGSILLSWTIHGAANLFSSLISAFSII